MQTIDQIFSDFPQKTMDLRQKVKSVSGDSASDEVTVAGLNVFLQADGGDLSIGVMAGSIQRIFVSQEQLGAIKIGYGDALLDGSDVYKVEAFMLEDGSPDVAPFYDLECKKL